METAADGGVAIVTGASSGIGAEFARQLAARRRPVLAIARRAARLDALAAEARAAGWAEIHPLALDVTLPEAAVTIRDRARSLGGAAWLVNNAGTSVVGRFLDGDPAAQAHLVRLNCESVVALSAAVVPDLVARGAGHLVNVASLAGFQPTPFHSVYGATKAFVLSLSESFSEELRGTGVTVTALCPGPVTTEIFEVAGAGVGRRKPSHEMTPEACVRVAIAEAERGAVIVVPGLLNKLGSLSSRFVPRSVVRRVAGRIGLRWIGVDEPAHRR